MFGVIIHLDSGNDDFCNLANDLCFYLHMQKIRCIILCENEAGCSTDTFRKLNKLGLLTCAELKLVSAGCSRLILRSICTSFHFPSYSTASHTTSAEKQASYVFLNLSNDDLIVQRAIELGCTTLGDASKQEDQPLLFEVLVGRLAKVIKQVTKAKCVGVIAKRKRILKLSQKGLIPLVPGKHRVMFVPMHPGAPCHIEVLQQIDLVVAKVSDFIEGICNESPKISHDMQSILDSLRHRGIPLVDSVDSMSCVFDRRQMCQLVEEISETARRKAAIPIRCPIWKYVDSYENAKLDILSVVGAGLGYPCILKPRIGCGPPDSHQMALVFRPEGLEETQIPRPGIIQEYINHGATVKKIYVVGDAVFSESKVSIPDIILTDGTVDIPSCIEFDSLHSLPTSLPWFSHDVQGRKYNSVPSILLSDAVLHRLASVVREHIKLSIFGFDIIVDQNAGELAIVDINYFPSFGNIQEAAAEAIQLFFENLHID